MASDIKHTRKKTVNAIPKFIGVAFTVFILLCCTPAMMPPLESDVQSAKKHWSDATHAQLSKGYNLYKNKCGSCHYLYRPDKFSEEKWKHEISEMSAKIQLDSAQITMITRYILTAKETNSFAKK